MQILAEPTGRARVEDGTHAYELSKKGMSSCKFKFKLRAVIRVFVMLCATATGLFSRKFGMTRPIGFSLISFDSQNLSYIEFKDYEKSEKIWFLGRALIADLKCLNIQLGDRLRYEIVSHTLTIRLVTNASGQIAILILSLNFND